MFQALPPDRLTLRLRLQLAALECTGMVAHARNGPIFWSYFERSEVLVHMCTSGLQLELLGFGLCHVGPPFPVRDPHSFPQVWHRASADAAGKVVSSRMDGTACTRCKCQSSKILLGHGLLPCGNAAGRFDPGVALEVPSNRRPGRSGAACALTLQNPCRRSYLDHQAELAGDDFSRRQDHGAQRPALYLTGRHLHLALPL